MKDNMDYKETATHTKFVVAYLDDWSWESHGDSKFPSALGRVKYIGKESKNQELRTGDQIKHKKVEEYEK